MKEKEGIIITGNFLSTSEKSDKFRHLVNLEICVAKVNSPSFNIGPRTLSIMEIMICWAVAAFIVCTYFDAIGAIKDLNGGSTSLSFWDNVAIFLIVSVLVALSYFYIKHEPKTYTEKLINILTKYKPVNKDAYSLIMNKLNEIRTLDLSEITTFIDNERKALKEIMVL
jgi:hypothetical protein